MGISYFSVYNLQKFVKVGYERVRTYYFQIIRFKEKSKFEK